MAPMLNACLAMNGPTSVLVFAVNLMSAHAVYISIVGAP